MRSDRGERRYCNSTTAGSFGDAQSPEQPPEKGGRAIFICQEGGFKGERKKKTWKFLESLGGEALLERY